MKYNLEIVETVTYSHTIEIECDYDEGELALILDEAEYEIGHRTDISGELEANGIKIISFDEDEDGNCDNFEFSSIEEII